MRVKDIISISKDSNNYFCLIRNFHENNSKLTLQLLGGERVRYCNIFPHDVVDIQLPLYESSYKFSSKVLYIDKIDHSLIVEKPLKAFKIDRRKFKRVDLHIPINVKSPNQGSSVFYTQNAIALNLSLNGIGMFSGYDFNIGKQLNISFTLPNGANVENIKGIVRSKSNSEYQSVIRYGIEFASLNWEQAVALIDFISKYFENPNKFIVKENFSVFRRSQ
jgi:c-di-GMP-binding flagellar brake protein YcgR